MRIKDIMPSLAQGIKTLVDWPFGRPHHTQDPGVAPYGDTWDIIWIGHCGSNHDGNFRIYSWNDTTVPPEDREYWFDTGLSPEQHTPGTRSVYQFGRTTCSSGYAISLQGAAKLVEYFKSSDENLDLKLSSACTRETDMTCLGVWPQIVTAVNTKSNIDHDGDGVGRPEDSEELHIEAGPALQFSARVNAKGVIESGYGRDEWIPEWNTSWAMKNGKWSLVKMNRTMDGGDELQPEKGKEELKETDVSDGGEIGSYEAYAGTTNAASRGERQEDGRRWKVKRA